MLVKLHGNTAETQVFVTKLRDSGDIHISEPGCDMKDYLQKTCRKDGRHEYLLFQR